LIHGKQDSAVPVHGSERFIEAVEQYCKGTEVRAELYDGKDHSFDSGATLEDQWLADGLAWVLDAWSST
jgi:dipeptidyl aminopeptidase/acylaminoacyl peptidase